MEVCSFCLKSSYSSNVVGLERLEFTDRHGWSTYVAEVVKEILPEATDAASICKECLRVIANFYLLKREISQRVYTEDADAELSENVVKDEFGEFAFAPTFNHENVAFSKEVIPAEDNQMSEARTLSIKTPGENPERVAAITEMAEPVAAKYKCEGEPMIETEDYVGAKDKVQSLTSKLGVKNYKWVLQKIDETRETSRNSNNWLCCVCFQVNHSVSVLRSHLKEHYSKGEFDLDLSAFNFDSIGSPAKVNIAEHTQVSLTPSWPDGTREIKSEILEPVAIRQESEDALLTVTDEPMDWKGTESNEHNNVSSTSNCDLKTAQQSILPNAELRMLNKMAVETAGKGYPCPYCFNGQFNRPNLIRHLVFVHSRNQNLFKAWLGRQIKKSMSFRKFSPKCCVCQKRTKSCANLRYHLTAHITQGEVTDADFLSPTTEASLQAKPIDGASMKQIKDRDMRKTENLNEKLGKTRNWKTNGFKTKRYQKIQIAALDRAVIKAQCKVSKYQGKVFKCGFCSATFPRYVAMFYHIVRSQAKPGQAGCSWIKRKLADVQLDDDGQRRCFVCEENFGSESTLRNHLKVHLQKGELDFAK